MSDTTTDRELVMTVSEALAVAKDRAARHVEELTEGEQALVVLAARVADQLGEWERSYVRALNAVLAAYDGNSADAHRWRGHAEAYRQVCERMRRDLGLEAVGYTSAEWRQANGVYTADQVAAFRASVDGEAEVARVRAGHGMDTAPRPGGLLGPLPRRSGDDVEAGNA